MCVGGATSQLQPACHTRVPQESVLGPFLFNFYTKLMVSIYNIIQESLV